MSDSGLEGVLRKLEAWRAAQLAAATVAAGEIAALLEGYAKGNHPWKPVTGATDNSTKGTVTSVTNDLITIVLSAGMDYDVFLELARGGQWAWLYPAAVANEARMIEILTKRLGPVGNMP